MRKVISILIEHPAVNTEHTKDMIHKVLIEAIGTEVYEVWDGIDDRPKATSISSYDIAQGSTVSMNR